MNHKRGKPREKVRCTLCTDNRENIGGDRARERHVAFANEGPRVSNGRFYDWCSNCDGTGKCDDCPDKICALCNGTRIMDFRRPHTVHNAG